MVNHILSPTSKISNLIRGARYSETITGGVSPDTVLFWGRNTVAKSQSLLTAALANTPVRPKTPLCTSCFSAYRFGNQHRTAAHLCPKPKHRWTQQGLTIFCFMAQLFACGIPCSMPVASRLVRYTGSGRHRLAYTPFCPHTRPIYVLLAQRLTLFIL